MSTFPIGRFSHKKIRLLNMYKQSLVLNSVLYNMHISLLLKGGNVTKCCYTQKPCKIGRSTILKPNLKTESHNRVTNPLLHGYCILSTKK